jgi:DNA-binding beta-propeller fold protein YncE
MSGPRTQGSPTMMLVVNTWSEDAVFYDLATFTETARIELPPQPHEVRHDRKRGLAYVTLPYRDGFYDIHEQEASELVVVDLASRKVAEVIELAPEVGPHGMYLDEGADVLWMSVETDGGAIIGFHLETREQVARISTGGGPGEGKPHWMTMLSDVSKAYTANKQSRYASVVDIKTGELKSKIPMPGGSEDVELNADETRLFVSSRDNPVLHVIDTASDEECGRVELDDAPGRLHMTSDGKLIVTHFHLPYQTNGVEEPGRISIVDPVSLEQVRSMTVGRTPIDLTSSTDGDLGYLCNAQSGTVWEIDLESMEVRREAVAGNAPHGVILY